MPEQVSAGKVALVTGAGSGIGKAIALRFADCGYHVGVLDRDGSSAREVSALIESQSESLALPLEANVADLSGMQRAVAGMEQRFGRIDVVVANAGGNGFLGKLQDVEPWMWDEVVSRNLRGLYLTTRLTLPLLKRCGDDSRRSLLVIASINGSRVFHLAGATAYTCSKAAQVAFVKSMALELAGDGVRVNAICPGWVATNVAKATRFLGSQRFEGSTIPLTGNRPATPEQVADLALFLASDAAAHITGAEITIDGGESLARARS